MVEVEPHHHRCGANHEDFREDCPQGWHKHDAHGLLRSTKYDDNRICGGSEDYLIAIVPSDG
jgi:hypothetical protein